uniref:Uncharacterized protein n=1 Tax=Sphaerodactylus townsendi TaxID=933632 RepID=A0ACB8F8C4_9SAUR
MFHSLKSTWDSASRQNMTDVRELTPEFFYLPEFLTNCNQFELGSLQDGTLLGDVQLPPWAEGSPQRFISLNRQALESDYVSCHLHHWIDLIFGHKQHGPAAVKAVNVFHPYFYGDKIHLDSISDPLTKNTILGFVSNFGQIPKQDGSVLTAGLLLLLQVLSLTPPPPLALPPLLYPLLHQRALTNSLPNHTQLLEHPRKHPLGRESPHSLFPKAFPASISQQPPSLEILFSSCQRCTSRTCNKYRCNHKGALAVKEQNVAPSTVEHCLLLGI